MAKFEDIADAFDFVSGAPMHELQAFLNRQTGEIYWHSELMDDEEELPADIDDETKYVPIPHQSELGLGKNVALNFAYQHLPDDVKQVETIFRGKGAYHRFKVLLEANGLLEQWYEFESQAKEKALREWCDAEEIEIDADGRQPPASG